MYILVLKRLLLIVLINGQLYLKLDKAESLAASTLEEFKSSKRSSCMHDPFMSKSASPLLTKAFHKEMRTIISNTAQTLKIVGYF